jgi:hypothetical protein
MRDSGVLGEAVMESSQLDNLAIAIHLVEPENETGNTSTTREQTNEA